LSDPLLDAANAISQSSPKIRAYAILEANETIDLKKSVLDLNLVIGTQGQEISDLQKAVADIGQVDLLQASATDALKTHVDSLDKSASDLSLIQAAHDQEINDLNARVEALEALVVAPVPPPPPVPVPTKTVIGLCSNLTGGAYLRPAVLSYGIRLYREEPSAEMVSWAHANESKVIGIYRNGNGLGSVNPVALTCDFVEDCNEPWWNGTGFDIAAWLRQMSKDADLAIAAKKPYLLSLLTWSGDPTFPPSGTFDNLGNWKGKPWTQWITESAPELWGKATGFAVHPYSPGRPFTNTCMDTVRGQLEKITDAKGKPFYVTEYGYASAPATDKWSAGSEQAQADLLGAQTDLLKARGDVAVACLYRWNDLNYTNSEGFYGIVRGDGSQKPAHAAVKARLA
jgi:hypothetical protein